MNSNEKLKTFDDINESRLTNLENDASSRWQTKKVDCESTINLLDENYIESFSANLPFEKIDNNGVSLTGSTKVEVITPRPTISATWQYKNFNLKGCNRLRVVMNVKAEGYYNFYTHLSIFSNNVWYKDAPSITPNNDAVILWELDEEKLNNIEKLMISVFMMGCPPEALDKVTIEIKEIVLEKVDLEYSYGWTVTNGISYHHLGYNPKMAKIAFAGNTNEKIFYLKDKSDKIVFTNDIVIKKTDIGEFKLLDFTTFRKKGFYKIVVGEYHTPYFEIGERIYDTAIIKSLNFLKSLRCGTDVPHVHSACHLNCRTYNALGDSVPNFGGWHDAGDVSQFEICTAEMAYALFELAAALNEHTNPLHQRILEEAKIGVDWLLRTRFGNGERALAVTYYIWRDNLLKANDKTVYLNNAENGPFENFLAAATEAFAARTFERSDPIYSKWALRAAIEDYNFALDGYKKGIHSLRWGKNIDQQISGALITAAVQIYKLTKNKALIEDAVKAASTIVLCQETVEIGDDKIRGFFYEDVEHRYMLSYEHRGHEETALKALVLLLEVASDHKDSEKWIQCLKLYREYIMNTLKYTAPYNLLLGGVYDLNKINLEHFTYPKGKEEEVLTNLQRQIKKGVKITDSVFIRKMPIAYSRKGFHTTLLSKTKGVAMIANYFNDRDLLKIANDQLEWIIGRNPFNTSTMYGEGHNYHPLYVAFSKQLIGALPVGFKTKNDEDIPYWPQAVDAVYKEIWGHTTGKYLSVVADIYKGYK